MESKRETTSSNDVAGVAVGRNAGLSDAIAAHGRYEIQCFDRDGNLKWSDDIENLVTTAGKNDALDKHLSGSGYTAAWYIGLIGAASYTTGPAVGDTAASHGGWVESTDYSEGSRPTAAFSAAAAGAKALSSALAFTLSGDVTIKGCFLVSNATKGGTTGIIYSAGLFTAGDKVLQSGDTLQVSYIASLT